MYNLHIFIRARIYIIARFIMALFDSGALYHGAFFLGAFFLGANYHIPPFYKWSANSKMVWNISVSQQKRGVIVNKKKLALTFHFRNSTTDLGLRCCCDK